MLSGRRLVEFIRNLPEHAPAVVAGLQDAAAKLHTAGEVVAAVSAASAPAKRFMDAVKQGRVRVEVKGGRFQVSMDDVDPRAR